MLLTFAGHARILLAALMLTLVLCGPGGAGSWPTIQSYPEVRTNPLVANNGVIYTVYTTIGDDDGYNDIVLVRVLFNFVEAASDPAKGRGYFTWSTSDSLITEYGGSWVIADASGGGRWGYMTDDWGGTTYITPIGCTVEVAGASSGGAGTRKVTFVFRVKPTWAMNPLTNDADVRAKDAAGNVIGWRDNPAGEFDVVAASCVSYSATPRAPVVTNPSTQSLDVAVAPEDSDEDQYCIRISPADPREQFVQADGTLGGLSVFRTKADWGTTTVTGLASDTQYSFKVRACRPTAGWCPSGWSDVTNGRTAVLNYVVDYAAPGIAINKGVHGMNDLAWTISTTSRAWNLDASRNTSIRYGGDGYNWKTRTAQWNSSTWSTLQVLREARDRNSYIQMLTNTRGIGTGNGTTWVYTDQTPETLAALTADWVFYCNKLVQTKRQGDALDAREQAVLDSMLWGTDDKLLAPGEAPVPKVTYWEIGNEPELPFPPPALTPEDYANRYKMISQAVLAEDPSIKVGPSMTNADKGNAWLDAVLSDQANRVGFVCYHPYGPLYGIVKTNSGGVLIAQDLATSIDHMKEQQTDRRQKVIERLVANGRPATTPLIASESNPSSWEGTYYFQLNRTMAHAMGVPETIFSFAQLGFLAAQYWDQPNFGGSTTIELPGFKMFKALQDCMGDRLLDSFEEQYFRLYTTLDTSTNELVVWALNFGEDRDKTVRFQLAGDTSGVRVTQQRLAAVNGTTSLITKNNAADPSENIRWAVADITNTIVPSDFTVLFPRATITMLRFDRPFMTLPDNTRVAMTGKSVTAAYPTEGYLYVEQDDRTYGIRVESSFEGVSVGDRVAIAGTIGTKKPDDTTNAERSVTAESIARISSGEPLKPLGVTCLWVGGGPTAYTSGVDKGFGLSSIGLLVRLAGKITQVVDDEHFLIHDGSRGVEGSPTDVLVRCPGTAGYSPETWAVVTGVVEGCVPQGWTTNRRHIRARTSEDVLPLGE